MWEIILNNAFFYITIMILLISVSFVWCMYIWRIKHKDFNDFKLKEKEQEVNLKIKFEQDLRNLNAKSNEQCNSEYENRISELEKKLKLEEIKNNLILNLCESDAFKYSTDYSKTKDLRAKVSDSFNDLKNII